ncbi:MAG: hypothetical protein EBX41_03490 [Chitinophagia bacterium]|nr:hypothetical protein [Chitinophagia bacterium]
MDMALIVKNYQVCITLGNKALNNKSFSIYKPTTLIVLKDLGSTYLSIATEGLEPKKDTAMLGLSNTLEAQLVSLHIIDPPQKITQKSKTENLNKAIFYYSQSLQLAAEINSFNILRDVNKALASIYKQQGNYAKSLACMEEYDRYKDSITNDENTKKILQTSMQYEYDKKHFADSLDNNAKQNAQLQKLKTQKSYTFIGIGAVVLLLGFSFFMVRNNKLLTTEKQHSESLLLNILPQNIADELKTTGSAKAQHHTM